MGRGRMRRWLDRLRAWWRDWCWCRTNLVGCCETRGDETHIWGQCVMCCRRYGVISREVVRWAMEQERRGK